MLKCPKCDKDLDVYVLTSCPPQYEAFCNCQFNLWFFDRENSLKHITQEEVNKHYKKNKDIKVNE